MYFQITWPCLWTKTILSEKKKNLPDGLGQLNTDKQKTFICLQKNYAELEPSILNSVKYICSVITTFALSNTLILFLKHISFTSHQMKRPNTKWRAGSSGPVTAERQNFRKEQKIKNEFEGWQNCGNLQKSWMSYGSPLLSIDNSNYSN